MMHRLSRWLLPVFGRVQRPAAWLLMTGGAVSFFAVLADLIKTGDAKWATLLVAADLTVSGFASTAAAENQAEDGGEAT